MFARPIPARLVGGPYDGDFGVLPPDRRVAPDRLWVWACTRGTCTVAHGECPAGGIHWEDRYDDLPSGAAAATYDVDEGGPDDRGVQPYIYAQLNQVPEGGLAVANVASDDVPWFSD